MWNTIGSIDCMAACCFLHGTVNEQSQKFIAVLCSTILVASPRLDQKLLSWLVGALPPPFPQAFSLRSYDACVTHIKSPHACVIRAIRTTIVHQVLLKKNTAACCCVFHMVQLYKQATTVVVLIVAVTEDG